MERMIETYNYKESVRLNVWRALVIEIKGMHRGGACASGMQVPVVTLYKLVMHVFAYIVQSESHTSALVPLREALERECVRQGCTSSGCLSWHFI